MNKIHQFFLDFISAEEIAAKNKRLPDLKLYNTSLTHMDSFLSANLKTRFGMLHATEPRDENYYEKCKKMATVSPRFLFKIDKINNKESGTLYKAYTSDINSDKSYFHCMIAQPIENTFQIIPRFTYGNGRDGYNKNLWYNSGGEEFDFDKLKAQEILRLIAPEDDDESMKMYFKD